MLKPVPPKVTVQAGESRSLSYTGRVSTFGKDFGVAVEVTATFPPDEVEAKSDLINEFAVRKHRELELAFMEARLPKEKA